MYFGLRDSLPTPISPTKHTMSTQYAHQCNLLKQLVNTRDQTETDGSRYRA